MSSLKAERAEAAFSQVGRATGHHVVPKEYQRASGFLIGEIAYLRLSTALFPPILVGPPDVF